jgi:hypothetical protein
MVNTCTLPPRAWVQGLTSLALLGLSTVAMLLRLEPFASWYYAFAWWSSIFFLDALVLARQGDSLLTRNPREFFILSAMSVSLWLLFEGWNLIMKNWYYAGASRSLLARRLNATICFATVLPAIFEAAELVGALGIFRDIQVRPIRVSKAICTIFSLLGVLFVLMPLLVPKYGFPFVWLGFILLLEPLNYRWARRSLLRDWEQGSMSMLIRVLMGGLICGLMWEMFNIRALTKWIYTVPFFEHLKLFEMPLAGFLGFPPFAVECYVMVQFISIFRGGKGWEPGHEQVLRPPPLRRHWRWAIVLVVGLSSLGMFQLMDRYTTNSLLPRLQDLRSLAPEDVSQLQKAGVDRLDLWMDCPEKLRPALNASGLPPQTIVRWEALAALAALKQMGTENLRLLIQAGIESPEQLARQDPDLLGPRLRAIHAETGWGRQAPRNNQVRIWVRAARRIHGGIH